MHLLKGILETEENVSQFVLQKMGVQVPLLKGKLEEAVRTYPRVEGAEKQYLSNEANRALSRARNLLKDFGDQYISIKQQTFTEPWETAQAHNPINQP